MAFLARLFQPLARDKTPPVRSAAPVNNDLLGWRRVFRPSFTTWLLDMWHEQSGLPFDTDEKALDSIRRIQQQRREGWTKNAPPSE